MSACGCCEPSPPLTPLDVENRDGLSRDRLPRRHLRELPRARCSRRSPPRPSSSALTTREDDDCVDHRARAVGGRRRRAELLPGALRQRGVPAHGDAARRRSAGSRALIDYRLRPGVAALALARLQRRGRQGAAASTSGLRVQSVPGQDEQPQTFETLGGLARGRRAQPAARAAAAVRRRARSPAGATEALLDPRAGRRSPRPPRSSRATACSLYATGSVGPRRGAACSPASASRRTARRSPGRRRCSATGPTAAPAAKVGRTFRLFGHTAPGLGDDADHRQRRSRAGSVVAGDDRLRAADPDGPSRSSRASRASRPARGCSSTTPAARPRIVTVTGVESGAQSLGGADRLRDGPHGQPLGAGDDRPPRDHRLRAERPERRVLGRTPTRVASPAPTVVLPGVRHDGRHDRDRPHARARRVPARRARRSRRPRARPDRPRRRRGDRPVAGRPWSPPRRSARRSRVAATAADATSVAPARPRPEGRHRALRRRSRAPSCPASSVLHAARSPSCACGSATARRARSSSARSDASRQRSRFRRRCAPPGPSPCGRDAQRRPGRRPARGLRRAATRRRASSSCRASRTRRPSLELAPRRGARAAHPGAALGADWRRRIAFATAAPRARRHDRARSARVTVGLAEPRRYALLWPASSRPAIAAADRAPGFRGARVLAGRTTACSLLPGPFDTAPAEFLRIDLALDEPLDLDPATAYLLGNVVAGEPRRDRPRRDRRRRRRRRRVPAPDAAQAAR